MTKPLSAARARSSHPPASRFPEDAWARRMLRSFVNDRLRGVTPNEHELRREMRRLWT